MNSSWERNDPQVLLAFLYELMSKVKRPEEIELLVEAALYIQQHRRMPRPLL